MFALKKISPILIVMKQLRRERERGREREEWQDVGGRQGTFFSFLRLMVEGRVCCSRRKTYCSVVIKRAEGKNRARETTGVGKNNENTCLGLFPPPPLLHSQQQQQALASFLSCFELETGITERVGGWGEREMEKETERVCVCVCICDRK